MTKEPESNDYPPYCIIETKSSSKLSEVYKWTMTIVLNEGTSTASNRKQRQPGEKTLAKSIQFVFQFPPIHGVFDTGYGVVYVFGEMYENEIEDIISHETLHYAVQKMAGKRASLKLDRVYDQILSD